MYSGGLWNMQANFVRCRWGVEGVSALPPCFSGVGRLLVGLFILKPPLPAHPQSLNPSHLHVHHSYSCTHNTHRQIWTHTDTHVTWGSLFWFCCGDKTRLCYIPLQGRQRALISHTASVFVCVCVCARVCVYWRKRAYCVLWMVSFLFLSCNIFFYLNWLSSLSSVKFGLAISSITDSYWLLRACVCAWQHQMCWPGRHVTAWHTFCPNGANLTRLLERTAPSSSPKRIL